MIQHLASERHQEVLNLVSCPFGSMSDNRPPSLQALNRALWNRRFERSQILSSSRQFFLAKLCACFRYVPLFWGLRRSLYLSSTNGLNLCWRCFSDTQKSMQSRFLGSNWGLSLLCQCGTSPNQSTGLGILFCLSRHVTSAQWMTKSTFGPNRILLFRFVLTSGLKIGEKILFYWRRISRIVDGRLIYFKVTLCTALIRKDTWLLPYWKHHFCFTFFGLECSRAPWYWTLLSYQNTHFHMSHFLTQSHI